MKHSLNPSRYSQLSSCMVHVWMSMGKFLRSMGQDRISVSLEEAEERRELLELGQSVGNSCHMEGKSRQCTRGEGST